MNFSSQPILLAACPQTTSAIPKCKTRAVLSIRTPGQAMNEADASGITRDVRLPASEHDGYICGARIMHLGEPIFSLQCRYCNCDEGNRSCKTAEPKQSLDLVAKAPGSLSDRPRSLNYSTAWSMKARSRASGVRATTVDALRPSAKRSNIAGRRRCLVVSGCPVRWMVARSPRIECRADGGFAARVVSQPGANFYIFNVS